MEKILSKLGILKTVWFSFFAGIVVLLVAGLISYLGIQTGVKGFEQLANMVTPEAVKQEMPGVHLLTSVEKLKKHVAELSSVKTEEGLEKIKIKLDKDFAYLNKSFPEKEVLKKMQKLTSSLEQIKKQEFILKNEWNSYKEKMLLKYGKLRKMLLERLDTVEYNFLVNQDKIKILLSENSNLKLRKSIAKTCQEVEVLNLYKDLLYHVSQLFAIKGELVEVEDEAYLAPVDDKIKALKTKVNDLIGCLQRRKEKVSQIKKDLNLLEKWLTELMQLKRQELVLLRKENNLLAQISQTEGQMSKISREIVTQVTREVGTLAKKLQGKTTFYKMLIMTLLVIAILSTIFMLFILKSFLEKRFHALKLLTQKLSECDFTETERVLEGEDELATLYCELLSTISKVKEALKNIKDSSEKMYGEAVKMEKVAEQLNLSAMHSEEVSEEARKVAEELKSFGKELGESMGRISQTVNKVSENLSQSMAVVQEVDTGLQDATQVVNQLVEASNKISSVSKFIGDIAEQTNLLALNATIEAARAGEAGKGFAVVANEIKELARQTSNYVNEIDSVVVEIQNSVKSVTQKITYISDSITKMINTYEEISSQTEAQLSVVNEVVENTREVENKIKEIAAVGEKIRNTVHHTVESAGEVNKASHKVKEVVEMLKKTVMKFKI